MNKIILKIYSFITNEKRIDFFRKLDGIARKVGGKLYTKTLGQYKYKLRYHNIAIADVSENVDVPEEQKDIFESLCWECEKEIEIIKKPLVSIIVPNYNHGDYLEERLETIYNQTYQNFEVILLDDCSTDNSQEILRRYAEKYEHNTSIIFNKNNSGRVFKQWNKGLQKAKGELIWIAESDDYSELDFLEKMVSCFKYRSVMLAFARSVFVQEGKKIWSTEEYLHDLPNLKWDRPFYMSANDLVQNGFAVHNIIPNVSSAVFRNMGKVSQEVENICQNMHLSGDWIFYLNMIKGSVVAYTNETTNYYRIHPQSTSLRVQKTEDYYIEFEQVSKYIARNYKVQEEVFLDIQKNLEQHYQALGAVIEDFELAKYYSIERIMKESQLRKPNIVMASYALRSGGGETYPIYLANELRKQDYTVTLLNFDLEEKEERIEHLVDRNVPIVNMKHTDYIGQILYHLGADVTHSHHASVDYALALWISNNLDLGKHIITLHGMYEAIEKEDCLRVIKQTWKSCYRFVYIADKNLECFKEHKVYDKRRFVKLPNGLPNIEIGRIERKELDIDEKDFVYVLASRGLKEKGWEEAIQAVRMANSNSKRKIHLVILGDGECRNELEKDAPEYVHFMGTVSNVSDYFKMGDAGILPSRFKGESYPLVIMECLKAGRPVIATDIAEVSNQIRDEKGNQAGILIPLNNWEFSVEKLAEEMEKLANNEEQYLMLKANTGSVSKKFDMSEVTRKYINLYYDACGM